MKNLLSKKSLLCLIVGVILGFILLMAVCKGSCDSDKSCDDRAKACGDKAKYEKSEKSCHDEAKSCGHGAKSEGYGDSKANTDQ